MRFDLYLRTSAKEGDSTRERKKGAHLSPLDFRPHLGPVLEDLGLDLFQRRSIVRRVFRRRESDLEVLDLFDEPFGRFTAASLSTRFSAVVHPSEESDLHAPHGAKDE